jgi:hypothetical protein
MARIKYSLFKQDPIMRQFFLKITNKSFNHYDYYESDSLFKEIYTTYRISPRLDITYESDDECNSYVMLKCKKFNNEYTLLYKPDNHIIFSDGNGYVFLKILYPNKLEFKEILFRFLRIIHL